MLLLLRDDSYVIFRFLQLDELHIMKSHFLMFKFFMFIQLSFLCTFFLQEDQIGFISSFVVVVESRIWKAHDLCFRKAGVSPSRQLKHVNDFRDGLLRNLDPSRSTSWPWEFSHPWFTPGNQHIWISFTVGHQVLQFSHDISSLFFGLEFYTGRTFTCRCII